MYLRLTLIIIGSLVLFRCERKSFRTEVDLSDKEKNYIISSSIRYSAKLPPQATHETKFNPKFNWYYENAVREYELLYYLESADSNQWFFMSRVARSITPMKEGIGGMLKIDKKGNLVEYNEIFRTWKMPEDTLKVRGKLLFDRMVSGRDLSIYGSKFQDDKYIEFPDERFVFDKTNRKWIDKVLDNHLE